MTLEYSGEVSAADWITRARVPAPAFVWPADHAWCVASDVDPHGAGIGAGRPAIAALTAAPDLDVVPARPDGPQPTYD